MIRIKQYLSLAFALLIMLTLAACSGNANPDNPTITPPSDNAPSQPEASDSEKTRDAVTKDAPIRISTSDIENMDGDVLNIYLDIQHTGGFMLDMYMGDSHINAIRYADGHDLVEYTVYGATGDVVHTQIAGQNQPYGILVEVIAPDHDWNIDSVSSVKITYSDDDGNTLSEEYDFYEIYVSENEAYSWFAAVEDNYRKVSGGNQSSQVLDTSATDGTFDISWITESAFSVTSVKDADTLTVKLHFDYLEESYSLNGKSLSFQFALYKNATDEGSLWGTDGGQDTPDEFRFDSLMYIPSAAPDITAEYDYVNKCIIVTNKGLPAYALDGDKVKMMIRVYYGSENIEFFIHEE